MDSQQLTAILAYQNEDIIYRFTNMMNVTEDEAQDIFTETKKFLYLSLLPGIFIPDELLILDEMWHNFILFTREYHAFCETNFARFLHHQPATKAEKLQHKELLVTDKDAAQSAFTAKLERVISTTYDHFGDDTVIKWFHTYPAIYSPENIKNLRKI
ncbi:MAG: hypothetical protein WKF66_07475 [Pedobacter sp.]